MSVRKLVSIIIVAALLVIGLGVFIMFDFTASGEDNLPVITLKSGKTVTISLGSKYREPGYSAKDYSGENITGLVKVSRQEIRTHGTYKITYTVKDSEGRIGTAVRKVRVVCPKVTKRGVRRGLSVFMYHKVYDAKNPPADIDTNCISNANLKKQIKYLVSKGYYFPTWQEVRAYLDGKIGLPAKSCVMTFDDGTAMFRKYGVPLIEKYDVRATAFIITSKNGKMWKSKHYKHVNLQSHSNNMHRPGGTIGHGGVFTALSYDKGLADLKKSTRILGSHEAFAYPFGDYNAKCKKAVKAAGFLVAFTTQNGKIYPGDDPYLLSRVRINGDISLATFKSLL